MESATILGIFGLATTIICALIHQEYMSRKRLKERLRRAEQDVLFLLEVEQLHCDKSRELRQASFKTRVRNEAFGHGFTWSGAFTPSRVRAAEIRRASALETTIVARLIVLARSSAFAAVAGACSQACGLACAMHAHGWGMPEQRPNAPPKGCAPPQWPASASHFIKNPENEKP